MPIDIIPWGRWERHPFGWLVAWGVLLLLAVRPAGASEGLDLLRKVDANLHPAGYQMFMQLQSQRPNGERSNYVLFKARHADGRSIVLVVSPAEVLGQSLLRVGERVWRHVPGELAERVEDLNGSFMDGVATYSELMPASWEQDYLAEVASEEEDQLRLVLTARPGRAVQPKVMMVVHPRLITPLKVNFFSAGGQPLKSILYADHKQFQPDLPPHPARVEYRSAMNKGYVTTVRIGRMEKRDIPEVFFTKEWLPRLGEVLK